MNIEYCREFIELAQCLNFTEAANKSNITQPALSKHILALEHEFGINLLDRRRGGVRLTEGGRLLFESANIIVNEYDKAKSAIDHLKSSHPVRVVGHMEDSDVATLVSMTAMLARENHHCTVVFSRNPGDPFELLAGRAIDLFVGYVNIEHAEEQGFRCIPFITNQLIAVVGTGHHLANRDSVTWKDLRNETLVRFMDDKTNPAWEQMILSCSAHGFQPKTRPVSAGNDVEFFSTPLKDSVLVWQTTQKQIGLLIDSGRRAGVPVVGEDSQLVVHAVYRPENEEHLQAFFAAAEEARALLDERKNRKGHQS